MMTEERYYKWTQWLRQRPGAVNMLRGVNRALTGLCYVLYPVALLYLYVMQDPRLVRAVLTPLISFAAISVFRRIFNAPRPYEALQIDPLIPKKTAGCSFPSRHVFSVFVIAITFSWLWSGMGMPLLCVGVALAVIRVLGGVHYPKDVIVGAIVGIASGVIGYYLIP